MTRAPHNAFEPMHYFRFLEQVRNGENTFFSHNGDAVSDWTALESSWGAVASYALAQQALAAQQVARCTTKGQ